MLVHIAGETPPVNYTEAIYDLEDRLEAAIRRGRLGRWDGHEIALNMSAAELFYSGKDVQRLLEAMLAVLDKIELPPGSYVLARGLDGAQQCIEL